MDNDGGHGVIHHAVDKRNFELIPWLVEQRADIDLQDTAGFTPVSSAVVRKHIPTVELLMGLRASLDTQAKSGAGCGPGVYAPASVTE